MKPFTKVFVYEEIILLITSMLIFCMFPETVFPSVYLLVIMSVCFFVLYVLGSLFYKFRFRTYLAIALAGVLYFILGFLPIYSSVFILSELGLHAESRSKIVITLSFQAFHEILGIASYISINE